MPEIITTLNISECQRTIIDNTGGNYQGALNDMEPRYVETTKRPRIGFVAGTFDLLHPGYIVMLQDAAGQCDRLVVGLHIDPNIERSEKNKPVLEWSDRKMILEALECVYLVRLYKTEADLVALMKWVKPDVRILGSDWRGKPYTGEYLGISIHWHERNHNWSSSELRRRVYDAELAKRYVYLVESETESG